jgi:hypothetical protein
MRLICIAKVGFIYRERNRIITVIEGGENTRPQIKSISPDPHFKKNSSLLCKSLSVQAVMPAICCGLFYAHN